MPYAGVVSAVLLAGALAGCCVDAAEIKLRSRTIYPAKEIACAGGFQSGAWIVQSPGEATAEWRESLLTAGARIHGYLPENAFLVVADADSLGRIAESVPHSYLAPWANASGAIGYSSLAGVSASASARS